MARSKSKQKGSAFERAICVQLSLWVSHGKSRDCFWRSAMSGGRATMGGRRGETLSRQAGDICAISPEGHELTARYYIELKHYKSLDIAQFFVSSTGALARFWLATKREADKYGKEPMLIAKQNHVETLVLLAGSGGGRLSPVATSWRVGAEAYYLSHILGKRFVPKWQ